MRHALDNLKFNTWKELQKPRLRLAELKDGRDTRAYLSALAAALTKDGPHHASLHSGVATELGLLDSSQLQKVKDNLAVYGAVLQDKVLRGKMSPDHMDFNAWSLLSSVADEIGKEKGGSGAELTPLKSTETPTNGTSTAAAASPKPAGKPGALSASSSLQDSDVVDNHNAQALLLDWAKGHAGASTQKQSTSDMGAATGFLRDNKKFLIDQLQKQREAASESRIKDADLVSLLKGKTVAQARAALNNAFEATQQAAIAATEQQERTTAERHLTALGRQPAKHAVPNNGHCLYYALRDSATGEKTVADENGALSTQLRQEILTTYLKLRDEERSKLEKLVGASANASANSSEGSLKAIQALYDRIFNGIGFPQTTSENWGGVEEAHLYAIANNRTVAYVAGDGTRICRPDGTRIHVGSSTDLGRYTVQLKNAVVILNTGSHFEATEPLTTPKP